MSPAPDRREVLKGGALVLAFQLLPARVWAQDSHGGEGPAPQGKRPGSLSDTPRLDAWIRVEADGAVTVFTGKAELGQGIGTALLQVAAEHLAVDPAKVRMHTADTGASPDEGFTAGSQSMSGSGTAIANAAAQVRALLVARAAERFGLDAPSLAAEAGSVRAPDGRSVTYGELVAGLDLAVEAAPQSPLVPPAEHRVIGRSLPRIDIPAKLTGQPAYVQDMRMPGMLHARVVRPPSYGARLEDVDAAAVEAMPGVVKVVGNGSFLAVVAEGEFQAIEAMDALDASSRWSGAAALPAASGIHDWLRRAEAEVTTIHQSGGAAPEGEWIAATYRRPYQIHGSIGPSCAVALFEAGRLTVWSHTQGVNPDRDAIAELVSMPAEAVRVVHVPGSGCYGHNGADDAAADAALIAIACPGRTVRLQWTRTQEHLFEPYGSAMVSQAGARLSADGRITQWSYDVWSTPHTMRPGSAGNLLAGQFVDPPFAPDAPASIPQPTGGGDRNAIPGYDLPNAVVRKHFVPEMPLRVSALRSLGAYHNVFSIESFVDELARRAGADPVAFRLAHLSDPRGRAVVETAAREFGWQNWRRRGSGHGRGFAYARYKNLAAYCAVAMDVEVEPDTGRIRLGRVVAACDSGQAVNPDGIRNQIEGGIVQAASWTLFEELDYGPEGNRSRDWASYPILRFADVPAFLAVHVIDRPDEPFLGTGEAAQGPTAGAIANAVADAAGARVRDLPLRPDRMTAALGA